MKYRHVLLTFFVSLLFILDIQAQQYEPPSREQVQRLLDELDECKDILKDAQGYLERMEENPEQVTLKTYQDTQKLINNAEGCIADRRKKLDELRKEYPGWFNSPNATVSISRGDFINPKELERLHKAIEIALASISKQLAAIKPPEK